MRTESFNPFMTVGDIMEETGEWITGGYGAVFNLCLN